MANPQAGIYVAGRWLGNYRADELPFAQIALAASQIAACNDRYGPDQPWGFADPASWQCRPRFCHAWASCPGGAGL